METSDIKDWNIASVTSMKNMFKDASAFCQDLAIWEINPNADKSAMFANAGTGCTPARTNPSWYTYCDTFERTKTPENKEALKTEIETAIAGSATANLNYIDISKIDDMSDLFKDKTTFNGDISCWNVVKVTNMNGMFSGATAFNGDIKDWNIASVTDYEKYVQGCECFLSRSQYVGGAVEHNASKSYYVC